MKKNYILRLKDEYLKSVNLINEELRPKINENGMINNLNNNKNNNNESHSPKNKSGNNIITTNIKSNLSSKKKTEDQMSKINKIFSESNVYIINTLIKHIWKTNSDLETEINSKVKNPNFRKYIIDIDTSLISLMSLIHSFPSLISILLKYHNSKKVSFISYLIHNIFKL